MHVSRGLFVRRTVLRLISTVIAASLVDIRRHGRHERNAKKQQIPVAHKWGFRFSWESLVRIEVWANQLCMCPSCPSWNRATASIPWRGHRKGNLDEGRQDEVSEAQNSINPPPQRRRSTSPTWMQIWVSTGHGGMIVEKRITWKQIESLTRSTLSL